jgi:ABC-type uncharacterized transport system ATPase subunit
VLRAGKRVATVARGDTDKRSLARFMVGREVATRTERTEARAGERCLVVRDIEAIGDRGLQVLFRVSLDVRRGQLVGVAGVSGNGQRELTEVIAGTRVLSGGTIEMDGVDVTAAPPGQRIRRGLAYVPEDRLGVGLVGAMDCVGNVMLKRIGDQRMTRGPFIDSATAERLTTDLVAEFGVQTPSVHAPVRLMSGGNIQKLLLARELSSDPKLLIASQPTAGLDVAAARAVHDILLEQRSKGVAILLVSEDLDELLTLADHIVVMYEGRVVGAVEGEAAEREKIGLMMAGTVSEDALS